jgi:DNA polymerase-3 subunit delta'
MARLLGQILGHQDIIEKMLHSFEVGKPGQTFLFVGPSGVGKKQVALGLAQALLCPESPRACGRCGSCLRAANGHHEGLKVVEPGGQNIKMEQAREVIEFLNLKSLSNNRVIVIDQAQTLNPQAANSLLKTLEEPPEGTFFFLIAPSVAGLMPTIRSRSRIVQFRPLTAQQLGEKIQAPQWALKAAAGSFEKLMQLQEGPEQELRKKAMECLKLFLQDQDFLMNEIWRQEMKDRSNAQSILSYWVGFFRDGLFFQEEAKEQLLNVDQPQMIKALGEIPRDRLLSLIQKTMQAEQAILANRDVQLVIENFWVQNKEYGMD